MEHAPTARIPTEATGGEQSLHEADTVVNDQRAGTAVALAQEEATDAITKPHRVKPLVDH
jgi:hypothetical protein